MIYTIKNNMTAKILAVMYSWNQARADYFNAKLLFISM